MTFDEKWERLGEENPDAKLADGFEDAFIGVARRFHTSLALYSRRQCIQILMDRDGMTEEEAEEFFSFNTQGAWVGEDTPVFADFFEDFYGEASTQFGRRARDHVGRSTKSHPQAEA